LLNVTNVVNLYHVSGMRENGMISHKDRCLLVNLPYYEDIFGRSAVKAAVSPTTIVMSLSTVAPAVRSLGCKVRILDLNLSRHPEAVFRAEMESFQPGYVGFSFTTAIFHLAKKYAEGAKRILPGTVVVAGGPHASVLPGEVLGHAAFDTVVRGEGDLTLADIIDNASLEKLPGISFRMGGEIVHNPLRPNIPNLDSLRFPALDLYDIPRYRHPRFMARQNPVAPMETSRGCYGACRFCSSRVTKFRVKSVDRVIDEMLYIRSLGFREIHLVDDMFTANIKRVKAICQTMIDRKLGISWYPRGGIRVDHVDQELFTLMKAAGVWKVAYGIESGNQDILNTIGKGITLDQIRHAIRLAKNAGLSVDGYFMLGHPEETEETIKETIRFSTSLGLDYAKYAINIPLPGTPQFDDWDRQGVIKTRDWTKYTFSTSPREIYDHPTVAWEIIEKYYRRAPRIFYFRPSYMAQRLIDDVRSGSLAGNAKTLLQSIPQWLPSRRANTTASRRAEVHK
jgi:anaerobic magnesium-protoporphyrin IX monomethyl ester cyclase